MVATGASGMTFTWLIPPTAAMGLRVKRAIVRLPALTLAAMQQFANICRDYAKSHHPWQNQTGAAEAGLSTDVQVNGFNIAMILYHTVYYGVFLELKFGGRDAIIMPTLQAHYAIAIALLRSALGAIWS